ncbi:hypothetical protein EYZ11_005891 [Aspergillus tanneri]|nr:hypothetical protein EYZ11_005891 [Aspergillus tanneri]
MSLEAISTPVSLCDWFLIERLLTRRKVVNEQNLVGTSREMLGLTLTFWKHKDRFNGLHSDFEWLAMPYAVPSVQSFVSSSFVKKAIQKLIPSDSRDPKSSSILVC